MRKGATAVLAMLLLATGPGASAQEGGEAVTVTVVELSPSREATLAAGESFFLHLRYSAGQPVRIWARPEWRGEPVREIFSHASPLHVGAGATLGWFAVSKPGLQVDAVRVTAVAVRDGATVWSETVPVMLSIGGQGPARHAEPAWAAPLRAADQAAIGRDARMASEQPSTMGEQALFVGTMVLGLAGILAGTLWPLWGLWRWSGLWRLAPLAPVAALGFVVARIVVDTLRDPTSHNLWPFEIALVAWPAAGYMLVLSIVRFAMRPRGGDAQAPAVWKG